LQINHLGAAANAGGKWKATGQQGSITIMVVQSMTMKFNEDPASLNYNSHLLLLEIIA
jgi:hypothetical protein